jgi:hypothetical protein
MKNNLINSVGVSGPRVSRDTTPELQRAFRSHGGATQSESSRHKSQQQLLPETARQSQVPVRVLSGFRRVDRQQQPDEQLVQKRGSRLALGSASNLSSRRQFRSDSHNSSPRSSRRTRDSPPILSDF